MGYSATIMTKEEAMKLPLKERPICFRVSSKIYHAVFESIGAASMCWNPPPSNEVFHSEKASEIAMDLLFKIAEELESSSNNSEVETCTENPDTCEPTCECNK